MEYILDLEKIMVRAEQLAKAKEQQEPTKQPNKQP
jgi:hypothetical protein